MPCTSLGPWICRVLRAGGPHLSGFPAALFFPPFFRIAFRPPKMLQRCPPRLKCAPTTPEMTQNPSPRHPKTDNFGLMKSLKNNCFYCGLGTLGSPRSDVLAIKRAIVAPTAQRTPKNRENVGQVLAKVAQRSQNGARGEGYL